MDTWAWAPPKGCPSRASAPVSRRETHPGGSILEHLLDKEGLLPRAMGHITRCGGRAFWDCTRLTTRCLGKAQEVGKGMDLGDFGMNKMNKCRENRERRRYKGLAKCNQLAVWHTCLATPCPICLLNEFLTLFLGEGLSIHYVRGCMGV